MGNAISNGHKECSILLMIVGLAVLREGSETVLFLYGIVTSQGVSSSALLLGGLIGLACGIGAGYALYSGLLRIPMRWFFTATSVLVLLLAANMASQAAHFLIQADLLPSLAAPLWDSSSLIAENSVSGMLLHGLIGYESQPAGMQVLFYCTAILLISGGMRWVNRSNSNLSKAKQP
jgi:high-affinity iron transporter